MKKGNYFLGLILISLGFLAILLKYVFDIHILEMNLDDLWIFIILLIGLTFEFSFFIFGSNPGLLIPGGIITTIGLLAIFEVATDWAFLEYTWPIYILSVSVGLFQMYLYSKKENGLLIASLIVACVSAVIEMLIVISNYTTDFINLCIPISLIAGGIAIFFSGLSKRKQ